MVDFPSKGPVQSASLAADVAAIRRIAAIPSILALACRTSGQRLVAIARVTGDRWVACAVHDQMDYGLIAGTELDYRTTFCSEVYGTWRPVVIDDVAEDPIYRDHPTPKLYHFSSYISVPIVRADGQWFGTLFAIDSRPARLANSAAVTAFPLLAELIALELDAGERSASA